MFFRPQLEIFTAPLRQRRRARALGPGGLAAWWLFLAVNAGWSGPVELAPRLITLPDGAGEPLFADIEGNGRCHLLVMDPVAKTLLNYRQRAEGFTNAPDQIIALPPQTAWVAVADIDPQPGLELVMSTATGVVYSRQDAGRFEAERHTLIQASQVFTNDDYPILTSLAAGAAGINPLIPVIGAGQTVLYQRNQAYQWSPQPARPLTATQTFWQVNRDAEGDSWALGSHPAQDFYLQQSFRVTAESKRDGKPENAVIQKLLSDLKKNAAAWPPHTYARDIDGDGQPDLLVWQVSGQLDSKTDVYIFLRGTDHQLPDRPTQILHGRGFPIPLGSTGQPVPVADLEGAGQPELVLLEFDYGLASASGILQRVLSHGLDCSLTVRAFHQRAFSGRPDASVPVTMILSAQILDDWTTFIQGDFNGDGRPDLLVRRSDTQWNIFFSTPDGRWFVPLPAMTFHTPVSGYIEIKDLNGDGRSDVIWHDPAKHGLTIFLSPPRPPKGKSP
jgi:hypothetical protein